MFKKETYASFLGALLMLALLVSFVCSKADTSFSLLLATSFEEEEKISENKVLSSSTQSLNRYHSVLRELPQTHFEYDAKRQEIELSLSNDQEQLQLKNIDARFLLPLLPYPHKKRIDDFDKANLLLAEFARNGISLSYQTDNSAFGFFSASAGLFNDEGEYYYHTEGIQPNRGVRPKRFSITNNCLDPGLWELNATDAVGEMYHAWFSLPEDRYQQMVKDQNGLENSVEELADFVANRQHFAGIPLDLARLREVRGEYLTSRAQLSQDKALGAYSSQDSRRKVQRGFFRILREGEAVALDKLEELQTGDAFSLHSFQAPGVYRTADRTTIPHNANWEEIVLREVSPKTSYGGRHEDFGKYGYLELELFAKDKSQSIIAGNIPIQLLVLGEDYQIPAFGAGVLPASEPIERRYLRLQQGPPPAYAYLTQLQDGKQFMLNNHPAGYEQIYLRPFLQKQQLMLRITIVSYERIVDLLEFVVPITGPLAEKINKASEEYQPPIHLVYQDSNIL